MHARAHTYTHTHTHEAMPEWIGMVDVVTDIGTHTDACMHTQTNRYTHTPAYN